MVAFCLFLLFVLSFVFPFFVYLFLFFVFSVSLPGDDVLCWLLSCPLSSNICFLYFSPNVFPVWFDLVPSIL